jgi:hypothetical protein
LFLEASYENRVKCQSRGSGPQVVVPLCPSTSLAIPSSSANFAFPWLPFLIRLEGITSVTMPVGCSVSFRVLHTLSLDGSSLLGAWVTSSVDHDSVSMLRLSSRLVEHIINPNSLSVVRSQS